MKTYYVEIAKANYEGHKPYYNCMDFLTKDDVINYCEENSYNLKEGESWHITSMDVDGFCYTEYELQDEANKNFASVGQHTIFGGSLN